MTMVSEKPCWEIMRCSGSGCVAQRHPETPCWELAETLNYTVSAHGVCRDCIVFVAKQTPSIFTDQELAVILSHPKAYGPNRPKCPALVSRERLWPIYSERRRATRYRIRGQAKAVIANQGACAGHVLDLSSKGLSFSHNRQKDWAGQLLQMDIRGEQFVIQGLPAQIVSDHPFPTSSPETRRCCVRFNTLSLLQRDLLDEVISQYGRPSYEESYC